MKTNKFFSLTFSLMLVVGMASFSGCKEEQPTPEAAISEEEAVELVESSMAKQSSGTASDAQDVAEMTSEIPNANTSCGFTDDSTIVRNFSYNQATANYVVTANWGITCTGSPVPMPTSANFGLNAIGNYATPRISGNDTSDCDFVITDLYTGNFYTLNGTANRKGSSTVKIRNQNSFNSTLNVSFNNVSFLKVSPYTLVSGTANFTLTATKAGASTVTYTGTITYTGNQSANVTINGNTYQINL